MALIQLVLPYAEGAYWLAKLRQSSWPMLLESGQVGQPLQAQTPLSVDEEISLGARFDIVVADPVVKLIHAQQHTTVVTQTETTVTSQDPFAAIQAWLQPNTVPNSVLREAGIPFAGGALGYFAYDLGRSIERLPCLAAQETPVPDMLVGIYDWAIIVDHHQQRAQLVSLARFRTVADIHSLHQQLLATATPEAREQFAVNGTLQHNLSPAGYAQAFARVKDYITAGDCYQINLAQRLSVPVSGDSWQAYEVFRQFSRAPFMAYLQVDDGQEQSFEILSMSPERFLQVREGVVETRPIKGTRPRHVDPVQDALVAESLAASSKDRAENLMIVDLLRNDIGKVCEIGSVKVDALFRLQRFTNVHHLVSIVRGRLAAGYHALDLLRGCFPGGSITGAPKLRAMEIIEALEPHRRHVYCGSIGYIGFDGSMDTNIAIRTAVIYRQQMTFYAGGGVVADSDCDKEYQETLDKASQFIRLVQHFQTQSHDRGS
ncbi:aminodeoxychorismate synthase component I [Methylophilus aquaticus]|uniref:aminodeoxychorismate synthase n=1 Tax=Methylophilus aquaticus TaxID=1971610 RepID=A0ABT9JRL0_9PROT|nr:aminodeoxychorismate synthase component I [Methylophilus aquaticus]MDP8567114.1 aminodeoxychorismate synthase component I [Methylophilus aquaticus]